MTEPTYMLPFRSAQDTTGDVQRVLEKLEQSGHVNDILRLVANSPNGFRPFVLMSDALLTRAVLPAAVREVAVLYLAVLRKSGYEWVEHSAMSARAGITERQREAVRAGRVDDAELFTSGQRLAMRVCGQLVGGAELTADTWRAMSDEWSVEGALDLVFTIGWWGGFVPLAINALRIHGLDGSLDSQ